MKDQRKFIHFHCFVFLFIIYPFTLSSTEYLTVGGENTDGRYLFIRIEEP